MTAERPARSALSGPAGCLFLVVGPSGVGKDTLIDLARRTLTLDYAFAQRTVTRPRDAGGEAHEPLTPDAFAMAEADGAFAVSWRAHGLAYGIRRQALEPLARGVNVIVNASRRTIAEFAALHTPTVVLSVTASPEAVRARLVARGREDADAVAARLAREVPIQSPVPVVTIANDGSIEGAADRFVSAIESKATLLRTARAASLCMAGEGVAVVNRGDPLVRARRLIGARRVDIAHGSRVARARLLLSDDAGAAPIGTVGLSTEVQARLCANAGDRLTVRAQTKPASRDALRAKVAGATLDADAIFALVADLAAGRYAPEEVAGFLVAASHTLSVDEVAALTLARARSRATVLPPWGHPIVADKHSMGGVPGSRITPVVVAIVAAHGLPVPKTSSRAITSAAGTADVMECVARVDLSPDELVRTVNRAGGAIAWSGRISHSAIDEVMNAINRPLGIRAAGLDVSSILSKKLAVNATHVLIDIPVGPGAKAADEGEAEALAALFRDVGGAVGLNVETLITDGRQPIGTGVGPAVELNDVIAVLTDAPGTDPALRAKALHVAGRILAWDPAVGIDSGADRAAALLSSGAAWDTFNAIADAQGRREVPCSPGAFTLPLTSDRSGVVEAVDNFALSGIARAAGAPRDKGAGVILNARAGDWVAAGETLAVVCATTPAALDAIDPGAALYRIT